MGVSRITAMVIQSRPDTDSMENDGIYVTAASVGNKWAGFVYLVKEGLPQMLLSTEPIFESEETATGKLNEYIAKIRNHKLSWGGA